MITPEGCQDVLQRLGYLPAGPLDGNLKSATSSTAVKKFQRSVGLSVDGIVGKKETGPALERYEGLLSRGPSKLVAARSWRFTGYHYADLVAGDMPVMDVNGKVLAKVSPHSFAQLSLEGSGFAWDGRVFNVTGKHVPCDAATFAPVLQIAQKNNWVPTKPGYAGISVATDGKGSYWVKSCFAFRQVPPSELGAYGYGVIAKVPLQPFRTAATDCGVHRSADPKYKKTGGVIPRQMKFWIAEWVGKKLPDGSEHDGWWQANDSGGGIEGNQCDLFCGTRALYKQMFVPPRGHLWYEGIEDRIPMGYEFGS